MRARDEEEYLYFNPLRPCGRRPSHYNVDPQQAYISIHSARVGGDEQKVAVAKTVMDFNPLRPCGRRPNSMFFRDDGADFNPLRPCGRRLQIAFSFPAGTGFQSTPPVWAETVRQVYTEVFKSISIHSARVGGDK